MTWLALIPLAVIAGAAWYWWRRGKRETTGAQLEAVTMTGPAPDGAGAFVAALCREMRWGGCRIQWSADRIPISDGHCDACVIDPWPPAIACRSIYSWRELLAHEAEHVRILRSGGSGEPDPARVAALLFRLG